MYKVILSTKNGNKELFSSVSPLVIQAYCQTQLKRNIAVTDIVGCSTIKRTAKSVSHIVKQ